MRENRSKSDPRAFRTKVPAKNAPKMRLGTCQNRFWRTLGTPSVRFCRFWGRSWPPLGCSWAFLGRSWVSFEHLLAALGHLLVASGCACVPPGWILKGFGYLRTTFWSVLGPVLDSIFGYNAFIAARCPAWISHTLFLLPAARRYVRSTWNQNARGHFSWRIRFSMNNLFNFLKKTKNEKSKNGKLS